MSTVWDFSKLCPSFLFSVSGFFYLWSTSAIYEDHMKQHLMFPFEINKYFLLKLFFIFTPLILKIPLRPKCSSLCLMWDLSSTYRMSDFHKLERLKWESFCWLMPLLFFQHPVWEWGHIITTATQNCGVESANKSAVEFRHAPTCTAAKHQPSWTKRKIYDPEEWLSCSEREGPSHAGATRKRPDRCWTLSRRLPGSPAYGPVREQEGSGPS